MDSPPKQFCYASVEIYVDVTLGLGSYGKVCKAKCGQLPCAAKILHDTMFLYNDPGIHSFARMFEQECQFLSTIKHPNIIQCLGTICNPLSGRPVLLMELMDESLTKFLERSTGPLSYHTQVNICHDIALALAYLHFNTIIHRDLSSNNVLLIGEGSRAKVTDFGMSKLVDMNPCMTPLTQCPGTSVYMPPEALSTPPRYTSKLDCFSHGVLTIQVITRNFPNPGDANKYVADPNYPTGRILVQFPETDRRKRDIDLIKPDHPLLPIARHCILDWEEERPSADELCERLALLKTETRYTQSVDLSKDRTSLVQRLQLEVELKEQEIQEHQRDLEAKNEEHRRALESIVEEYRRELNAKDEMHQKEEEYQKMYFREMVAKAEEHQSELGKKREEYCRELERKTEEYQRELEKMEEYRREMEATVQQLQNEKCQKELHHKEQDDIRPESQPLARELKDFPLQTDYHSMNIGDHPVTMKWRQGEPAPENMTSSLGAAVVHLNTAYFSQESNVYSYEPSEDKWTKLPPSPLRYFSLVVVNDTLTTIGGWTGNLKRTNALLGLSESGSWKEFLPPMPTKRRSPAAVTTFNHLVVAGGEGTNRYGLSTVEVLNTENLQWLAATSLPKAIGYPSMVRCDGYFYISTGSTVYTCSVEKLLQSSDKSSKDVDSVWSRIADVKDCSKLATFEGHMLAIGGVSGGISLGVLQCYDRDANSWSVVSEMPTPRYNILSAVLPREKLMVVVGGAGKGLLEFSAETEICCLEY